MYISILSIVVFFNDTSTTEIYTYRHTLSLHDALPIFIDAGYDQAVRPFPDHLRHGAVVPGDDGGARGHGLNHDQPEGLGPVDRRSEEHTSELQSLMRISYAVFCLKKKKNKK